MTIKDTIKIIYRPFNLILQD